LEQALKARGSSSAQYEAIRCKLRYLLTVINSFQASESDVFLSLAAGANTLAEHATPPDPLGAFRKLFGTFCE